MDLKQFDTVRQASKGAAMTLRNPITNAELLKSDGKPITITLLGNDSGEARRLQATAADRKLGQMMSKGKVKLSSVELQDDNINLLVGCTVSWDGVQFGEGEFPCTPENARKLYTELPWLRDQANAFIDDRANFLGN